MEAHLAAELRTRQKAVECGVTDRAREVLQRERRVELLELARHAEKRCDADSSSEQEVMCRRGIEREVIARGADREQVALGDTFVHGARTTARVRLALDRDD